MICCGAFSSFTDHGCYAEVELELGHGYVTCYVDWRFGGLFINKRSGGVGIRRSGLASRAVHGVRVNSYMGCCSVSTAAQKASVAFGRLRADAMYGVRSVRPDGALRGAGAGRQVPVGNCTAALRAIWG